jgi:hypothetical protein
MKEIHRYKMADSKSKEVFYVNINNSHDLRRTILETSKAVIENLHSFEKFKSIRAERIKAMEQLIIQFREINDISSQMKIDMPKIKIPAFKKKLEAKVKKEIEPPKKEFKHETDDELKKLEAAISQIENRLQEIK